MARGSARGVSAARQRLRRASPSPTAPRAPSRTTEPMNASYTESRTRASWCRGDHSGGRRGSRGDPPRRIARDRAAVLRRAWTRERTLRLLPPGAARARAAVSISRSRPDVTVADRSGRTTRPAMCSRSSTLTSAARGCAGSSSDRTSAARSAARSASTVISMARVSGGVRAPSDRVLAP